jgi:hypothetical protein
MPRVNAIVRRANLMVAFMLLFNGYRNRTDERARTWTPKPMADSPIADSTSVRIGKLLRAVGALRSQKVLSAEEVLVFLTIGHLGIVPTNGSYKVRPVPCNDISAILKIPRETVRRRLSRSIDMNLVSVSPAGFVVENVEEWKLIVKSILE